VWHSVQGDVAAAQLVAVTSPVGITATSKATSPSTTSTSCHGHQPGPRHGYQPGRQHYYRQYDAATHRPTNRLRRRIRSNAANNG
jgi:hypothetical protein